MIHYFYIGNGNLQQAAQLYAERWPNRHRPDLASVHWRFMETGSVVPFQSNADRPRNVLVPAVEERIKQLFVDDSTISVREVAHQVGVAQSRVYVVIKDTGKHPFHYCRVQELLKRDYEPRVHFCVGFLAQVHNDENFVNLILWTDECTFTRNGMLNQHNYHFWAEENPHLTRETIFQYRWNINVWAGMIGNRLVSKKKSEAHYPLPQTLIKKNYVFLEHSFREKLIYVWLPNLSVVHCVSSPTNCGAQFAWVGNVKRFINYN